MLGASGGKTGLARLDFRMMGFFKGGGETEFDGVRPSVNGRVK